jgi:hypothetical protein
LKNQGKNAPTLRWIMPAFAASLAGFKIAHVMAALVAAIHALLGGEEGRGCPGQARA